MRYELIRLFIYTCIGLGIGGTIDVLGPNLTWWQVLMLALITWFIIFSAEQLIKEVVPRLRRRK